MPDPSSAFVLGASGHGIAMGSPWDRHGERGKMKQEQRCQNFNHRRSNAPVRFCPTCGGVVNQSLPIKKCTQEEHAKRRRGRNKFCVDCSEQLVKGNN